MFPQKPKKPVEMKEDTTHTSGATHVFLFIQPIWYFKYVHKVHIFSNALHA